MVTDYLMNALLITMFVIIGILALYAIFSGIKYICNKVITIQRNREFEKQILNERFEYLGREIDTTRRYCYELSERISKLEEKKKNVKKK